MQLHLPTRFKQPLVALVENQLALMAAILLEVSIRHFSYHSQSGVAFITAWAQLLLECSPLLLAHYYTFRQRGWRSILIWLCGFILYPAFSLVLAAYVPHFAQWTLFWVQSWVFLVIASIGFGLSRLIARHNHTQYTQFISRLFSLNSVLLLLMLSWAILWAGIFASTDDPVSNQPIKTVINSDTIIVNFNFFLSYLWQFTVMGLLVLCIYGLNRYVLIRYALARSGVFAYAASCLISIIIMTPILATVVLWLPMNIEQWTFLPSEDYNVFAPSNFRFSFFVFAVSTPIILAFERQQQDKALAEVAQRQSQTELQLLQQQVNPHFLFNTLNNLYALTLTGSKQAPIVIMQLANLLRYTVYEGQNIRVTLAQEIQYIQDFLALQAMRSPDKCQLSVHYPEQAENWLMAPLLLIIIVENAFKHGVEPSQSDCCVLIDFNIKGSCLTMRCVNSLPATASTRVSGIGLENLRRRLALLYAGKHSLSAKTHNGQWHTELSLELEPCTVP